MHFNWRLITLQYCSGFCHTLTWIHHGYTCVPHPEPPSHLPPYHIPLGHPSASALSTLSHVSNLDWRSVSHMIIYMFQCYSLKSSHPHPLPQSPKDCSIHVSLLLSRIQGYHYHLSKFHIYAFSSVQSLSRVRLFATPWIAARQASLSITISRSSLRLTSIESMMPSSHIILCCPLLLLSQIPPSIRVFSNESTLHMRWPKYWSCILYWCFSSWLTSFCIIGFSFIHLIRTDSNVFFLMAE